MYVREIQRQTDRQRSSFLSLFKTFYRTKVFLYTLKLNKGVRIK